jgi:hypothetical protein
LLLVVSCCCPGSCRTASTHLSSLWCWAPESWRLEIDGEFSLVFLKEGCPSDGQRLMGRGRGRSDAGTARSRVEAARVSTGSKLLAKPRSASVPNPKMWIHLQTEPVHYNGCPNLNQPVRILNLFPPKPCQPK